MNEYDVVVIGGGAAGLSAALVLSRARRAVAVVDAGQPRNEPAAHLQGFLSRDGMPPHELLAVGRSEVGAYGGQVIAGTVTGIVADGASFRVTLGDGQQLNARRVLVSTGLRDELPTIPGAAERWGRDLLHCPYCHGYEVRDQPLGVLGGTPNAVDHALLLRQWSPDVVFFPHTDQLTTDGHEQLLARGVAVVEGAVARLVVEHDRLDGVELEDGTVVRRTAVFVRPRLIPNSALLVDAGCSVDQTGFAVTDAVGRTSVPGLWVAGNAVNPRAQVITAAGEGSSAAIAINADLVDEDVTRAVRDSHADVRTAAVAPPTKHQLALMIWLAVFPTLTLLNLTLGSRLADLPVALRTFVLATVAVPIVIYGLMPHLHRLRKLLILRTAMS